MANKATAESIKVICRFRGGQEDNPNWKFNEDGVSLRAPSQFPGSQNGRTFTFDRILDKDIDQETTYNLVAKKNIESFMKGYNGTIFAYG